MKYLSHILKCSPAILFSLVLPCPVHAAPVTFTFNTTFGSSAIAGVSAGDSITLEVVVDNGGSSLVSQSWLNTDFVSATASVGSYTAIYNAPSYAVPVVFTTDAGGLISSVNFFDIDSNNQDIFGVGGLVAFGTDAIRDFSGNLANFSGCVVPPGTGPNCSDDASLWTVSSVPVPAAAWLFGSGLVGLLSMARRKQL